MTFDKDYFENGLITGKSCYENYRWIPELTIPFANEIIEWNSIMRDEKILDFGCAHGYLVKALRLLHYDAWGTDISEYALSKVPKDIKDYVFSWIKEDWLYEVPSYYDWMIIKDVLEHIKYKNIVKLLPMFKTMTDNIFVIVPLGKDGKYNAKVNNLDPTHIICEDMDWWTKLFTRFDWKIVKSCTQIDFIKQSYNHIENAHGFFTLKT